MSAVRTLHHLVWSDFLERVRRYSFLLVLALTVLAGYLFVPPEGAGYLVLFVGRKRGIYNSAWIGLMFGFIAASQLALIGFFLVRNAVERDRRTGVGQIIATTPVSKPVYVLGKWLSNLAVLALILFVMTAMGVLMQLIRGEETAINIWALVAPIWVMGLPVLAIAAALAVLFETAPFLRGSVGSVIYFFVWGAALASVLARGIDQDTDLARPFNDLYAYTRQLEAIQQQVLAVDPDASMSSGLITPLQGRQASTFIWDGVAWTADIIWPRSIWGGVALAVALASAIPFDRFDPARSKQKDSGEAAFSGRRRRGEPRRPRVAPPARGPGDAYAQTVGLSAASAAHLTAATAAGRAGRLTGVLLAELKMMFRGRSWVWYAGAIGLVVACLVSPIDFARQYLLPAVWLWPLLIWSQMGVREVRHNTRQVIFSTPRPVLRQLIPMWLAGVLLTLAVGSGGWIRLALAEGMAALLAWLVGALFVPSLALALGVWVGNGRAFELLYLLLWYVGVVNRMPAFDFAGTTPEGMAMGMPNVFLAVTAGLLALALLGRWRQLRS